MIADFPVRTARRQMHNVFPLHSYLDRDVADFQRENSLIDFADTKIYCESTRSTSSLSMDPVRRNPHQMCVKLTTILKKKQLKRTQLQEQLGKGNIQMEMQSWQSKVSSKMNIITTNLEQKLLECHESEGKRPFTMNQDADHIIATKYWI